MHACKHLPCVETALKWRSGECIFVGFFAVRVGLWPEAASAALCCGVHERTQQLRCCNSEVGLAIGRNSLQVEVTIAKPAFGGIVAAAYLKTAWEVGVFMG